MTFQEKLNSTNSLLPNRIIWGYVMKICVILYISGWDSSLCTWVEEILNSIVQFRVLGIGRGSKTNLRLPTPKLTWIHWYLWHCCLGGSYEFCNWPFCEISWLAIGSGQRFQILSHVFSRCASQTTHGHAKIARVSARMQGAKDSLGSKRQQNQRVKISPCKNWRAYPCTTSTWHWWTETKRKRKCPNWEQDSGIHNVEPAATKQKYGTRPTDPTEYFNL